MDRPSYTVGKVVFPPWFPVTQKAPLMNVSNKLTVADPAMVAAIKDQTAAILELAQAIREHAYLTAPEPDEDDEPSTYMDGTPVQ